LSTSDSNLSTSRHHLSLPVPRSENNKTYNQPKLFLMKTMNLKLALFLASATGASCFSNLGHPATRATIGISASSRAFPHRIESFGMEQTRQMTSRLGITTTTTALDKALEEGSSTKKLPFPIVLWRFSRPHTLIGSALAIPALHCLAAPTLQAAVSSANIVAMLYAMVPSLLMNVYITGLNQITDVEIDKVNKPNLPIVAGDLSMKTAIVTVLVCLVLSLALGAAHPALGSNGLNVALWGSCILGTIYSLAPFRLKRFPLLAAFCIVAVRGTIINAGFFAHAQSAAFGVAGATFWNCLFGNLRCGLSSLFFAVFGVVIALMKDVPDVRGDKLANVRTLSVRIGQKRVFNSSKRLLMGLFLAVGGGFAKGAVQAPSALFAGFRGTISVASVLAALSIRKEGQKVDPENPKEVYHFYMHLWKLFYLSYLALFIVR